MDVLTLRGVLTLDKSEYDKGLTDADSSARSFGGRFSKAMKIGAAGMALLGAGTALASKKIVSGAKDVAEYGDHVDKMSQKIGISTDAYQKWNYVMQLSDVNIDSLKMGMKTLSQQAEKNSDAFQQLGISQEEVANSSKEELFEKTVKGLAAMEDSTERTALASKLLGRAGADMAPLLNQGSDAIEEQMEIAEKYGMVMPEATVKASAAFQDSMTTLQMTAEGLKNRLLGEFLPAMTKVTDGLALMFTGDMSGLDDVVSGVKEFIGKIGAMAPKVLEVGGKIIAQLVQGLVKKIPSLIAAGGEMFGKLLEGLQNSIGTASGTITNIITAIVQFLTDNMPMILQTGIKIAVAIAKGMINAIPTVVASVPKIIQGIVKTITSFAWSSLGRKIVKGISKGIRNAGSAIKAAISRPVKAARNAIVNGFQAAKDKAVQYMQSLKDKVTEKISAARDKVKEIVEKIKGFFPLSVGKIFSNIKVPKINVSGGKAPYGIGGFGKKPSITVSWNKKAMETPYLFSNATIFGAGEAGDEILYGKESLLGDIRKAVKTENVSNGNVIINLNYNANEDASDMVRDIARSVKRYRMAGAI